MDAKRWNQIKEIYDRALDLRGDERAGFLAAACGDDPALHAEVDSLLRAHEQAGSFLDEPVCELAAESATACQSDGLVGEEAVQSHLSGMIFIRVNPELDPIRTDPRFKELVRRMGLSD